MEGTVGSDVVVVVLDGGVVPEDAEDGLSTPHCPSGARDVWGDVATADATAQDAHLEVDVAAAVAPAAAVIAATATAYLG